MIRRKILTVLASAVLIALAAAPPVAAAAYGTCVDSPGSYHIGGHLEPQLGYNETIEATIDPIGTYFKNCGYWDPNDWHGEGWSASAAWVALENPFVGGLIQFGMVECDNGNDNQKSWCDTGGYPSLLMAYQGCGGIGEVRLDFGNIGDFQAHRYRLSVDRNTRRVKAFFDGTQMGFVSFDDPRVGCFVTASSTFVEVFAERRNRGDGLGWGQGSPLLFSNLGVGSGSSVEGPWWPSCEVVEPSSGTGRGYCSTGAYGSGELRAWTVY